MTIFVVWKDLLSFKPIYIPLNYPNTWTDLQPGHDFSVFHLGDLGLVLEFLHEGIHQVHQAFH